jgi:hypothetical protein
MLAMPPALSVVRVTPIVARKDFGNVLGEVRYSDGSVARFRVSTVDPLDVRLIDGAGLHAYGEALRAWWAEHKDRVG